MQTDEDPDLRIAKMQFIPDYTYNNTSSHRYRSLELMEGAPIPENAKLISSFCQEFTLWKEYQLPDQTTHSEWLRILRFTAKKRSYREVLNVEGKHIFYIKVPTSDSELCGYSELYEPKKVREFCEKGSLYASYVQIRAGGECASWVQIEEPDCERRKEPPKETPTETPTLQSTLNRLRFKLASLIAPGPIR